MTRTRYDNRHDVALSLPNPHEWVGRAGAMSLLGGISHVTLGRMVAEGLLTAYQIEGGPRLYWREQVAELATARVRAGVAK